MGSTVDAPPAGVLASPGRRLVGIALAAFNLRLAIVGVGPLLEELRADTGMSNALAGSLTTMPVLAMAVFGFVGASVVARMGAKRLVAWALAVLGLATALRGAMPSAGLILAATVPISISIALVGAALPGVVKRHFPDRGGGVTGLYVSAQSIGAAVASFGAVPAARALGGWRAAFALAAVPAALALPVWLRAGVGWAERSKDRFRLPRPSRTAVVLAVIFGLQSLSFYAMITWVAVVYLQAGWAPGDAALTTAGIALLGVPASLIVPALSDGRDRRYWVAATSASAAVGVAGVALMPAELPWLWLTLFALGNGALFPLSLTLPLDVSDDPAEVSRATAWTLGLGYLIAGAGPVTVGAMRDLTGGFELPLLCVAALVLVPGALALAVLRPGARSVRRRDHA